MNPDNPQTPREQLETRLTALLLGEASADEAAELRQAIKDDPQLAELYHRLEETIHLVREAGPAPSAQSTPQPAPLKLSDDRRQKLLAQFKTVTPREFSRPQKPPHQRTRFDTIIEIAAVLVLIGVLVGMLLPSLRSGRSKANYVERAPAKLAGREESDKRVPSGDLAPPEYQVKEEPISRSDIEAKKGDEQTAVPGPGSNGGYSLNAVGYYNTTNMANPLTPPSAQTPKQEIFLPSNTETAEVAKEQGQKVELQGLSTLAGEKAPTPIVTVQFASGGMGGGGGGGGAGGRGSNVGDLATAGTPGQLDAGHSFSNQFIGRYAYTATASGAIDPATGLPAGSVVSLNSTTGLPISNNDANANTFYRNTTESNTRLPDATMFWSAGQPPISGATGTFTIIDGNPVPTTPEANTRLRAALVPLGQPMTRGVTPIPGLTHTPPMTSDPGSAPPVNFDDRLAMGKDVAASDLPEAAAKLALIDGMAAKPGGSNFGEMVSTNMVAPSQPGQSNKLESDAPWRFSGGKPNVGVLGRVSQPSTDREKLTENITNLGDIQQVPILGGTGASFNSSNKPDPVMVNNGIALSQLAESEEKISLGVQPESLAKSSTAEPTPAAADKNLGEVTTGTTTRQLAELKLAERKSAALSNEQLLADDRSLPHPATPAAIPQPEVQTSSNAFSTFSLNVSDVSFKLAAASLEKGVMPDPATVRSEEFINAFDYRDPAPPPGAPIGFAWERSQDPFAQNRDLLRFSVQTAAAGREAGRPLNLVLLLDNSGSMERADRVQIIHEALRVLAAQLQPQDTLSVVTFARTPRLWVDGVPGSQAGDVAEKVSGLTPQGGTNLEDAMKLAYETALRHYLANGINRVVLLTDGAANLGNVDPDTLKQKVETNRKQGIALDCFGIGWEGYNDDLLEVLSRNGDGRYGFINTPEDAATGFAGQLAGALHVAAADVKVQVEFNPARVNSYRQIGYAKHQLTKQQFRDNTVDAAEIGAAESGNALYTVEVNPQGDGPLATVRVRYKVPATGEYREQAWPVPYAGASAPLDKSSPAMRLSATASAFSEWLVSSPYAAEVTPDQLLNYLGGVPDVYGADARPKKLEWMLRQAKSLSGK